MTHTQSWKKRFRKKNHDAMSFDVMARDVDVDGQIASSVERRLRRISEPKSYSSGHGKTISKERS